MKIFKFVVTVSVFKPLYSLPTALEKLTNVKSPHGKTGGLQWGVEKVQADKIWSQGFRGQGVVVAHVGTGVSETHEALANNFRSNYDCFDPYEGSETPTDQHGSGTHSLS